TLLMILILSSRATIPLRSLAKATRKIGQGEFNVAIPNITSRDEIGMLSSSFVAMQENLIKYVNNLQTTTAAKEKIEKELSIAREIQRSIVPHNFPAVKEFELYAELLPAREVGGDLYDFFFIDNTHLCFAIGDVSGKGVPAALFMAITKTLLRAKISLHSNPDEVIRAMNNDLFRDNESVMFVTFFLCILNIQTGELECCNAGHNPPLLYKSGKEFEYLTTDNPSPPIGILEDAEYSTQKIKLFPEDIFFLYTDGITEAMNNQDSQFSDEKLLEIMSNNKNKPVIEIVNNVISAVADHASGADQSDDITLLVLKYKG
ncbi:MAG: SpoIIE family protein phosphatase, partial [Lentisphaerota bacterium]